MVFKARRGILGPRGTSGPQDSRGTPGSWASLVLRAWWDIQERRVLRGRKECLVYRETTALLVTRAERAPLERRVCLGLRESRGPWGTQANAELRGQMDSGD